jgi:hypothetical protein
MCISDYNQYSLRFFKIVGAQKSQKMSQKISTLNDDKVIMDDEIHDEEELDPRVQEELEKLNYHTDEINRLELQLEDANCLFRTILTDSTHQLKSMSQKVNIFSRERSSTCSNDCFVVVVVVVGIFIL